MEAKMLGRAIPAYALLILGALAMLALSLHARAAVHAATGPTMDHAISIDVDGGGDDCDTRASTGIGATCNVPVGNMFTVKGFVDGWKGISGAGTGYGGIRFRNNHSAGLTLNQRAMVLEMGSPSYWPPCSGPSESKPAGGYQVECHQFGSPSTYIGKVVEVDYTCTMAGAQTVTMQDANTFFYDTPGHAIDNSDAEGDEVLTINCISAVGGIARLPYASGAAALEAGDSSSFGTGLFVEIVALATVIAMIGGAFWRLRARRAR